MSIAKKISQKKQLIQEFFLSKSLHTLENVLLSIRLPCTTVPCPDQELFCFIFETSVGKTVRLFMNMARDIPLSYFDETIY